MDVAADVGVDSALDLLLSSRRVYAEEALRIRLATRVCPGEELLSESKAYIQTLADGCAPQSMATIKRQVYEDLALSLGESLDKTFLLMQESFDRPDFKEGVQAFVEKRPPKFARIEIENQ